MSRIGLVAEGGGMKCAYSAGIMDKFLDYGIKFDYCIGVSAGSANLASLMAGQRERNLHFYVDHVKDPDYFGVRPFLKTGNLFNLQYIYGTLTNEDGAEALDFDKILENPCEYELAATNALTGKPEYFNKNQMIKNNYIHIMASSAIPAVSKPVLINQVPYFDGGVSDAIPARRALDNGCDKLVFVLSKSRHYKKKPQGMKFIYSLLCHKYPAIIKDLNNRHIMYTAAQKLMFELEKQGKAFIFSLETGLKISTYAMDPVLNRKLYDNGLSDFEAKKEAFFKFMEK
ncbi:MAG TPA: patatin family protein [Candidatus Alectryocaccobium stercorigallinarum]|nr:patatin family protein [Candidatus Alectryocaccobium stercorigallinarum]